MLVARPSCLKRSSMGRESRITRFIHRNGASASVKQTIVASHVATKRCDLLSRG